MFVACHRPSGTDDGPAMPQWAMHAVGYRLTQPSLPLQ